MNDFFRDLAANLAAGLRLALFLPVRLLAFRIDVAQVLTLFVVSALVDIGTDWIRYGEEAYFSWFGLGNEVLSGGFLVLTAAVLSLLYRDRSLTLSIPVIALAAFPVLQVANSLPWVRLGVPTLIAWLLGNAVLTWIFVALARAVYVALEYKSLLRPLRALLGGLLLGAPIFFASYVAPVDPWFVQPSADAADPRYPSAASEPVMRLQSELLDDALSSLDDGRAGVVDLYFAGFAGDGTEDVFRKDVEAAKKVMDERWGTNGRSIALVNNPRTLLTTPIATLSNLRDTLEEFAGAMDADEDVAMVYIASHGSRDHQIVARMPPLDLVSITPENLRSAFDDAGIRYRVVVISACYAGGFIDALADDDTAVIVAAQADRQSFGCGADSESTYFGDAFFQQGMAKAGSVAEAFELAKGIVAERERAEGLSTPSNPQIRIGSGIAARLAEIRRRGGGTQLQVRGRSVPAA